MLARYKPSPALVVACLALFAALGGVGYALVGSGVPDNAGVFHGCVNNAGAVRLVSASTPCKAPVAGQPNSGEKAVSWSQQGPAGANGTKIVARLRGGPLTATNTPQTVPLSPSSWQQPGNEDDQLIGQMTLVRPSATACTQKVGASETPGLAVANVKVDGVGAASPAFAANGTTQIVQLANLSMIAGGSTFTHTVELSFSDNCGSGGASGTTHFKIDATAFDVVGAL